MVCWGLNGLLLPFVSGRNVAQSSDETRNPFDLINSQTAMATETQPDHLIPHDRAHKDFSCMSPGVEYRRLMCLASRS
eukprot:621891-Hanusia_phi.AAC.1